MVARTLLAALLAFHSRVQQLQRVSNENVVDAQPGVAFPPLAPVIPEREGHLARSEEHTSELQSQSNLVCRLLLEKKKKKSSRKDRELQTDTRNRNLLLRKGNHGHTDNPPPIVRQALTSPIGDHNAADLETPRSQ